MRGLSKQFMSALREGILFPILERVRRDDTLQLAIRDNYINIYYRGGNLMKLTEQTTESYPAEFDENYNKAGNKLPSRASTIQSLEDARSWVIAIPHLKEVMDFFLAVHGKAEREFQQLVSRENNSSPISNETEYFITDIEFADTSLGARVDMLAIQWLAGDRKSGANCRPALIEMKYGDGALGGTAGLGKHLRDLDALVSDHAKYTTLLESMEAQFEQLSELGLIRYNQCSNGTKVELNSSEPPLVIILLANHNPRSSKLQSLLSNPDVLAHMESSNFDLRFFVAGFSGYGMHEQYMFSPEQLGQLLEIIDSA